MKKLSFLGLGLTLVLTLGCTPDNGASPTPPGGSSQGGSAGAAAGSGGSGSPSGNAGSGGSGSAGSGGASGSGGGSAGRGGSGSGGSGGAGGSMKAPDAAGAVDSAGAPGSASPSNWPGCIQPVITGYTPAEFCPVYEKTCGFAGMDHYTSLMDCMTTFKGGSSDRDGCKAGHLCRAATVPQTPAMKESDCQTAGKANCRN